MEIERLGTFIGKHCETTALKRAMDFHGIYLSEEMLIGIGGGISFMYWYGKNMPYPFIGARNGGIPSFVENICRRIGITATVIETTSLRKGYLNLKSLLATGEPVITYGDIAYLPHYAIAETTHFGGHGFIVFDLDETENKVSIFDRGLKPVTISIDDLNRSRNSKHTPFPPKNRLIKIQCPSRLNDLKEGIKAGIRESYQDMTNPVIKNRGLPGMKKWSKEILKWSSMFEGINMLGALISSFVYIETGGTGGNAFRFVYADFLDEASEVIEEPVMREAADILRESAVVWGDIARGHLPDSYPTLKKMRELTLRKNEYFEQQAPGALESMNKINEEIRSMLKPALTELVYAPEFLKDVQQNIIRCYELEWKAFQLLASI
jgi:hypothetical protein